jgi:hypothetical protein
MPQRALAVAVLSLLFLTAGTVRDVHAKGYVAPTRSLAQVSHAISISNPSISKGKRSALAKLLIKVAKKHNFDPLSGWAIIDHESDWRPKAVGPDGEDIGLAQIRYTQSRVCRKDRDSKACQARRESLFDPAVNIGAMAHAITAWRELCEKKTGRAPNMQNWLAGYGGYSRPKEGIFCGRKRVKTKKGVRWKELPVPTPVADIISARKSMIRRLRKDEVK